MAEPCIFSFFAGAGFLDLGFELNGYHMAHVNELHAPFMKTYKHSRQVLGLSIPEFGYHQEDISDFILEPKRSELRELVQRANDKYGMVGFIGGPPCPDFSVGGKNRGRTGDNGKLTATYVELICQQRPSFFLFENVKGLWKTAKHRVFYEEMKQKLHDSGYKTTERIINTLEFGVPQYRERVILMGFKAELLQRMGYHFDGTIIPDGLFPWEKHIKYPVSEVFKYPWPATEAFVEDEIRACPNGIPQELTVEYWFRKNDVQNHPNAKQYFQPRAGLSKFIAIEEGDDSKKSYKRLHRWRYSPTAAYGNNEVHLHPYKARRISVAEALAIQSLPKEFTLPQDITLTDAFKTVGNGVPFLAASAIATTILDFLGVTKCDSPHMISSPPSMDYLRIEAITT